MKNKKEQMKKVVEVARRNLIGDISEKSKKAFDVAIKLSKDDIKKVNDDLHDRIYFLLGRILVHTQLGKFTMQHVMDGDYGEIMLGAENQVKNDVVEMADKMEESIGYSTAMLDKKLEEQADEMIGIILGEPEKKCCDKKCNGECKKPARDSKGRFVKKTCDRKCKVKTAKNKKTGKVAWF